MTIKITSQNVKIFDDEASAPGYHFEYLGIMASDAAPADEVAATESGGWSTYPHAIRRAQAR